MCGKVHHFIHFLIPQLNSITYAYKSHPINPIDSLDTHTLSLCFIFHKLTKLFSYAQNLNPLECPTTLFRTHSLHISLKCIFESRVVKFTLTNTKILNPRVFVMECTKCGPQCDVGVIWGGMGNAERVENAKIDQEVAINFLHVREMTLYHNRTRKGRGLGVVFWLGRISYICFCSFSFHRKLQ